MNIDFTLINGLSVGAEYVQADYEAGIDFPCIVIDLLIFRIVLELDGK